MQSNAARAAVAVVSIAAVVILFVVLSGGDDDEGTTTTATAQTTTTTTGKPGKTGSGEKADKPEASEVPLITVVGGQPEDGVADLSFDKGDEVAFEVTSDAADEVHVHGYDIEEELSPGKPAEITFPADIEGVFEVELHSSEAQIAQLTVSP